MTKIIHHKKEKSEKPHSKEAKHDAHPKHADLAATDKKITSIEKKIEELKPSKVKTPVEAAPIAQASPQPTETKAHEAAEEKQEVPSEEPVQEEPQESTEDRQTPPPVILAPDLTVKKEDYKGMVEAVLFASGKYMDEDTLAQLCNIDKRSLKKALEELKKDYDAKNGALAIFQEGNSWKINVREKHLHLVRKIVADTELNRSVMETLAVVAWKTPIYQSEVVRIRGNKCYDHIEELENAGFITKDKKGRSYVLKTTDKFYNYFDIDKGNLKSVLEGIKMPELKVEQTTLADATTVKAEEPAKKIEEIEVKKKTESDEEKEMQKNFLDQMEQKIADVAKKNEELAQEIPTPTLNQPAGSQQPEQPSEQQSSMDQPVELPETPAENIILGQEPGNAAEQPPADQAPPTPEEPKHKSLTKKQLEKKFKDDLLRVREKMEKK